MPGLGHVVVGLAAGKLHAGGARRLAPMAFYSGLSLLPDADVVAFKLGIPYSAPWGHRGAFHSLAIALGLGVLAGLAATALGLSGKRVGLISTAVLVSHDLLDACTDGGLGIALLWPSTNERFFLPWQFIPVAPIGLAALSGPGLTVARAELAIFAPLLLFALWPKRAARPAG